MARPWRELVGQELQEIRETEVGKRYPIERAVEVTNADGSTKLRIKFRSGAVLEI